jgi:hypothetical protein
MTIKIAAIMRRARSMPLMICGVSPVLRRANIIVNAIAITKKTIAMMSRAPAAIELSEHLTIPQLNKELCPTFQPGRATPRIVKRVAKAVKPAAMNNINEFRSIATCFVK